MLDKLNLEMKTPSIFSAIGQSTVCKFSSSEFFPSFQKVENSLIFNRLLTSSGFCETRPFSVEMFYSIARNSACNCVED